MKRSLGLALRRLVGLVPGVGRMGSADAAAYERAARDAYRSATITDLAPAPASSPAPSPAAVRPMRSETTLTPRSDAQRDDESYPIAADVSRTAPGGASVGVGQTAETLHGAIRPWGPKAPAAAPTTFTIDPFRAEAAEAVAAGAAEAVVARAEPVTAAPTEVVTVGAQEWVAVMSTVADQETEADWVVDVVDAASRLSHRQIGDTAPEFLMRTPPSVGLTVDAFFDGLVRRVESDR